VGVPSGIRVGHLSNQRRMRYRLKHVYRSQFVFYFLFHYICLGTLFSNIVFIRNFENCCWKLQHFRDWIKLQHYNSNCAWHVSCIAQQYERTATQGGKNEDIFKSCIQYGSAAVFNSNFLIAWWYANRFKHVENNLKLRNPELSDYNKRWHVKRWIRSDS
jgi:hypothetical protein